MLKNLSKKAKIIIFIICLILAIGGGVGALVYIEVTDGNKISYINIASSPFKTTYYVNEPADYSGFQLNVVKKNGSFDIVDHTLCSFEGFDTSVAKEDLEIKVTYKTFTTTFTIDVFDTPVVEKVLSSIYLLTLPKTEYKVGEFLDTDGGVIVKVYNDNSTSKINLINSYVYGFDSSTIGTKTLEVVCVERGIVAKTTYDIIVSE